MYTCTECGAEKIESIDPTNVHIYGAWYEFIPATEAASGEERRDCAHCDAYESREIPMLESVLYGDVNHDGKVNTLDRMVLTRYLAKWDAYPESSIDMKAADVNNDGRVNTLDRVILTRYLAKWDAYAELPYAG